MEVFTFNKSLLDRLNEANNVLHNDSAPVPASQVRREWSYMIELVVEPSGWNALWRIPRVVCEALKVRYPTNVYGTVESVNFKETKAKFKVDSVQDMEYSIPEHHEVLLQDLWPTKNQENEVLNVERTADAIDQLRYFFNHIWMPWDNDTDDDQDWADKHLETRIRFSYDLKRKSMKRSMAAHIRSLLMEAKYIQQRREHLERNIETDEEDLNETPNKPIIKDLMKLHLRLATIRNEIELLENPQMRKIYEEMKYSRKLNNADKNWKRCADNVKSDCKPIRTYIVSLPGSLNNQLKYLDMVKAMIPVDKSVQIVSSLQEALDICNACDEIFLPQGIHNIKFLEYLNEKGTIRGVTYEGNKENMNQMNSATLLSCDDDSILLVFDGDFVLENLLIDCRNVRRGMLMRKGNITLRNCTLLGDPTSTTRQGIVVEGESILTVDSCVIKDFACGVYGSDESQISLRNSLITNCIAGVELIDNSNITFVGDHNRIANSRQFGISVEVKTVDGNYKRLTYQSIADMTSVRRKGPMIFGNCEIVKSQLSNVIVISEKAEHIFENEETLKSDSYKYVVSLDASSNSSVEGANDNNTDIHATSDVEPILSNEAMTINSVISVDEDPSIIIID